MARLFADEDFHQRVAEELVRLGHDVLTCPAAGLAGRGVDDARILAFATAQGRAVLTHNRRHFIRLHATSQPHAGIIVCTRDDANPVALAGRVHAAIIGVPALNDLLVRVQRPAAPPPTP
jgi:hypothetical protein